MFQLEMLDVDAHYLVEAMKRMNAIEHNNRYDYIIYKEQPPEESY